MNEEQLRDLPSFEESAAYTPLEKLVIEYAVVMTKTPVEVPEPLFSALRQQLDEPQLVELTAAIAWENYRARFDHALDIGAQGFSEGAFCVMPERKASG